MSIAVGGGKPGVQTANRCPNCGNVGMGVFYEVCGAPVNDVVLLFSRREALDFPRGDIRLAFCPGCGFISNIAFDPALVEYGSGYEGTQAYSPTFNEFNRKLAERLVNEYALRRKDIIEIGCGQGEFLNLLCELGDNRGIGFDPAFVEERDIYPKHTGARFIADFFSEKYGYLVSDFVCCKQTLEHIQNTEEFIKMIRKTIGDRPETTVFFQVPDVERILKEGAFWDIFYEHCSYFSVTSLTTLFRRCGFEVIASRTEYGGQYLMIEARPGDSAVVSDHGEGVARIAQDVEYFSNRYIETIQSWRASLSEYAKGGHKVVLWGGGSKAVGFLTAVNVSNEIEYVVDINPKKDGTFLPGSGLGVISPEHLRSYRPGVIVIMNPIYTEEIASQVRSLGLNAELVPITPISTV